MRRSRWLALLFTMVVASCERSAPDRGDSPAAAPSPPVAVDASRTASPPAAAPAPGPPIDPGTFVRYGCATDASPPHIATGTATVTWRPAGGGGAFSFRNVPARCGGAFPGQLIDGIRSRPGDGVEFVVCMPDERRLDVGFLQRGPVAPGVQDVAHRAELVRLRILLDRYVNVVSPAGTDDPVAHVTFGPRLRTASGTARLGGPTGTPAGVVEFEIDCTHR